MFCMKCGSENVAATSQKNNKVYIERGELDSESGRFDEEYEAPVLQCSDCSTEMVQL